MSKRKQEPVSKKPGWLNQSELAASLGISTQALKKWDVQPVAKIGRETFYTVKDVVNNRVNSWAEKHSQSASKTTTFDVEEIGDPVERLKALKLEQEIRALTLKNNILEGKSLPAFATAEVVTRILSVAVDLFETMPLEITRKFPDLDTRVTSMIEKTVAKVRNEAALVDTQLDDVLKQIISDAEDKVS